MKLPRLLAFSAAALFLSAISNAATIAWSTATGITADTDVSTTGTGVYAYDFGSSAVNPVINGVIFTGITGNVPNLTTTISTANGSAFTSATTPYSALSANYRSLLDSGNFIDTTATQTVTLNNLLIGSTYQVQIWVNDPRSIGAQLRQETLGDGAGNDVLIKFSNTATAGVPGQFVTGTFTANSSSQTINVLPVTVSGTTPSAQINALQLRLIPEPASALLGGASLGLFAMRRRRIPA